MGNETHTNTLHEKLDVETRRKVERALVEQPPGLETYAKVYEGYGLGGCGISLKALERYGGYLRALARNRWIGELADAITGGELKGTEIAGLIRSRLLETLITGETTIGDLLKASMAESNLAGATIKREQWEAKREAAAKAVQRSERDPRDPGKALAELRADIRSIYGLAGDERERTADGHAPLAV